MSDPAYEHEMDELARLCRGFIRERERGPDARTAQLLLVGAIVGQAANIYNLAPPGGLINPGSFFTGGPATPRTTWRVNEPFSGAPIRLVVDSDDPEVLRLIEEAASANDLDLEREAS